MQKQAVRRLVFWYNLVPIIFWSGINLFPIFFFWINAPTKITIFIYSGLSFFPVFLPKKWIGKLQLSKNIRTYRMMRVNLVNSLVQRGKLVNYFLRKKYPEYKAVAFSNFSRSKIIQKTYTFEKFHLVMFVFFSLSMVQALIGGAYVLAVWLGVCNVLYNVLPNLLQQYVRLRISQR